MFTGLVATGCSEKAPQLGKNSIDEVINAMTLEEKLHLMIGTGGDLDSEIPSAVVGKTENIVPGAAGTT